MCNLPDCLISPTISVEQARVAGVNDANENRRLRQPYSEDADVDLAYRHAYAEAAFHIAKNRLLEQVQASGGV